MFKHNDVLHADGLCCPCPKRRRISIAVGYTQSQCTLLHLTSLKSGERKRVEGAVKKNQPIQHPLYYPVHAFVTKGQGFANHSTRLKQDHKRFALTSFLHLCRPTASLRYRWGSTPKHWRICSNSRTPEDRKGRTTARLLSLRSLT